MKRILFITAFVPNKTGAGENFSRQFINDIAKNNLVDLILFRYAYDREYICESENVKVIKQFRNNKLIKIFNFLMFPFVFPLFSVRFNFFRLSFIKKLIRKNLYDLIIFDFSQTFLYAKFINHSRIVLNCHDVIAQRYSRIYKEMLKPIVIKSEKYIFKNLNANIFCHSEKDKKLLESLYSFHPQVTSLYFEKSVIDTKPAYVGDYFVFFANWKRKDNFNGLVWFFKFVFPHVNNENKNIKIIGSGLPLKVKKEINKYPTIEYMGFLENPYIIITNAKALISPLFTGAGIKVKVMDSLACGTHVIGTEISFEGIPEVFSDFLVHAETEKEFINVINSFKTNVTEKARLKNTFLKSASSNALKNYIDNI